VAVLGVACALVARAFCWLLHSMEHEVPRRLPGPLGACRLWAVFPLVDLSYLIGVSRFYGSGMGVISVAL
jgi:hypothetical protein